MIDLFKLLQIEMREDKYTYCLISFIEKSPEFRKRAGDKYFGFKNDFECYRGAFNDELKNIIIPDIVLYNDTRIVIIESKMFSSEGYNQTNKYAKAKEYIKAKLNKPEASVGFYYLTLAGNESESDEFKPIPWAKFYTEVLKDISFDDKCLDLLRDTFFMQANKYSSFKEGWETQNYTDLFNEETYWVTPYSILSAGMLDKEWQATNPDKKFSIYNGSLNGKGHSDFRTDLKRADWHKEGLESCDNIHLFIRIEWEKEVVNVYLNWENYDEKTQISDKHIVIDYIATKDLPEKVKNNVISNKRAFFFSREKPSTNIDEYLTIKKCSAKKNALHILKCAVKCSDRNIEEVITSIKHVIEHYENEIDSIFDSLKIEDGYWHYSQNI